MEQDEFKEISEEDADKNIEKLNEMKDIINTEPNREVQESKINDPSAGLENSFEKFVEHAFTASQKSWDFNDFLQDKLKEDIKDGKVNTNQLLTLYINHNISLNDRMSRLIQPFAQMSLKQAELATLENINKNEPLNMKDAKQMNEGANKRVLQGLDSLNKLISVVLKPEEVKEDTKPKGEDEEE
jgi:hypothetical protein